MIVKTLSTDKYANAFVVTHLKGQNIGENGGIVTWTSNLGGHKTVAVFSVAEDRMLKAKDFPTAKKLSASIYALHPATTKVWKQLHREEITPKQLQPSELYVALNTTPKPNFDPKTLIAELETLTRDSISAKVTERAGGVVYTQLPTYQIIGQSHSHIGKAKYVGYGCTGLYNIAELVLTLKASIVSDIPRVVFDTYGASATARPTLLGLCESLKLINPHVYINEILKLVSAFDYDKPASFVQVLPENARAVFISSGLSNCVSLIPEKPMVLSEWYRRALTLVAQEFSRILNIALEVKIVDTTDTLAHLKGWSISTIARELQDILKHQVNILNGPRGMQLHSEDLKLHSWKSLETLHTEGFWASGAVLYFAQYTRAKNEKFVAVVFDGAKGGIHKLAQAQMEQENLWVCPVGSTHMKVHNSNYLIDPWVFLSLLKAWGPSKSTEVVRKIWHTCQVPLLSSEIGQKSVISVNKNGISIEKKV